MDQENKLTATDRIDSMYNVLDKLANIPEGGRIKCGYVWILNDLLNGLRDDVLVMQERLAAQHVKNEEPSIELGLVSEEELETERAAVQNETS